MNFHGPDSDFAGQILGSPQGVDQQVLPHPLSLRGLINSQPADQDHRQIDAGQPLRLVLGECVEGDGVAREGIVALTVDSPAVTST